MMTSPQKWKFTFVAWREGLPHETSEHAGKDILRFICSHKVTDFPEIKSVEIKDSPA